MFVERDETEAEKLARGLQAILMKHRALASKVVLSRWADEFRILGKNYTYEELFAVIEWYGAHFRHKYTPKAYSASSFRAKFPAIYLMAVDSGAVAPKVEITPEARDVAFACGHIQWPNGEKEHVPAVAQLCLLACYDFMCRLERARKESRVSPEMAAFLRSRVGSPKDLTIRWIEDLARRAWEDPFWVGSLFEHAISVKSKRFRASLAEWLYEWKGPGKHLDTFLASLEYENK